MTEQWGRVTITTQIHLRVDVEGREALILAILTLHSLLDGQTMLNPKKPKDFDPDDDGFMFDEYAQWALEQIQVLMDEGFDDQAATLSNLIFIKDEDSDYTLEETE